MKIFGVLLIALASFLVGFALIHQSSTPRLVLVQHILSCGKEQGEIFIASDGESAQAPSGTPVPKGVQQAALTVPCGDAST